MMRYLLSVLFSLVGQASYAQEEGVSGSFFIVYIAIMAILFFFILRPQWKRAKTHANMVAALKKGDDVLTAGGIKGTVQAIDEESGFCQVEVADNVVIHVLKSTISQVIEKQTSQKAAKLNAKLPSNKKKAA